MRIVMRPLAPLALATLLCACASTPTTTSYSKPATRIKGIAIQPPGLPEKPGVQTLGSSGSGFSFPTPFSGSDSKDAAAADATVKELQNIFAQANYDYKKDLRDSLQSALSKSGMPTITVHGERPLKERAKFMGQCPPVPGADACLDVYVTFVGFTAASAATDYVPMVELNAKLIRIADNTTLFQDQIIYNAAAGTQAIVVQPSGKYKFRDRAAMKANPQAVTAAVKEAMQSVATTLVKQFQ